MSAPKTRHQINGIAMPIAPVSRKNAPPTMIVDINTPSVLSSKTANQPLRKSARSTWRAPANSRKLSMPCISVCEKSMRVRKASTMSEMAVPGTNSSIRIRITDVPAPITVSPMTCGSRMKR